MHQEGRVVVLVVLLILVFGFGSPAGAQLRKINIAYTATSPYQAALIITRDAGLFRKYGLDVVLIFTAGGSLGVQAMLSGDVAMNLSDSAASVRSKLSGVDNLHFESKMAADESLTAKVAGA